VGGVADPGHFPVSPDCAGGSGGEPGGGPDGGCGHGAGGGVVAGGGLFHGDGGDDQLGQRQAGASAGDCVGVDGHLAGRSVFGGRSAVVGDEGSVDPAGCHGRCLSHPDLRKGRKVAG